MYYLYAMHRTKKTAVFLCKIVGGINENLFVVLRPEFFPRLEQELKAEGEEIVILETDRYQVIRDI